ncbi:DUF4867 family protein [uncultured Megasphaera sp.]|uniref:DUF4867 family protein n=1 Tax=uncultured Megasphaera sp. TaxID=165188 RepID=UPI0025D290FC|nr:DUF4867 family protein [uncultured Megasphaera sp.]
MKQVTDKEFAVYGRVLDVDIKEFAEVMNSVPVVSEGTMYEPSVGAFEALPLAKTLEEESFGFLPIEFGHCSGHNDTLNALEYHRSSEIDIAATDLILLVGRQQDIDLSSYTYDTARVEAFFVPAGTAVELYATTLHFAPCSVDGKEFRCGVVLPKGTNEALPHKVGGHGENALLFAVNKWLIAHEESGLQKDHAWIGLVGENIKI